MKIIVLFFSLIAFCQCSPAVQIRAGNSLRGNSVSESDVKIYFISQSHPTNPIQVDLYNPKEVTANGYSNEKDTVFVIHGFQDKYTSPVCVEISEAVIKKEDANVFIVDWNKISRQEYVVAQASVPGVAKVLSRRINSLVKHNALDLNRTFIAGHSLGAHIAGFCGADLKGKLSHIIGLDPALPLFEQANKDERIDSSDAKFVQIIHTNSGQLGFNKTIGHVDYWPNGGGIGQPGCVDDSGWCAHNRSYNYFAESIVTGGFISRKCDNYKDFQEGKCNSQATSFMGEFYPDKQARGNYFLNTNSYSPYALN